MKAVVTESVLAATVIEALRLRDHARNDGATSAELDANMERTLRAAWPQVREWKYLCKGCRDLGLEMLTCPGDATCGRDHEHLPHKFGKPCWCSRGIRFREKPKPGPEDFSHQAGVAKKKPSRFGR